MALSHHPLWLASLAASCSKRSMSSWMRTLTLAKGSAAIFEAKAMSKVLRMERPWAVNRSTTACLPSVGAATCAWTWTKAGAASASSAAASMASMDPGLRATSLAKRTETACWAKRIVAALVFSETSPLMMPMACASVASSSERTRERWSQVRALSLHISESSLVYSLSCINTAFTVESCWLFSWISAMASSRAFFALAIASFSSLISWVFVCTNCSCAARDSTSALSTATFSLRKSSSNFSRVATMPSEWKS
mmetsp:Transcript_123423/g.345551  ORF Transcript_123423/g.345551 Transcript_123423/m.345551 type:complete len:253 (-) Transcript_123423:738-1496(-)